MSDVMLVLASILDPIIGGLFTRLLTHLRSVSLKSASAIAHSLSIRDVIVKGRKFSSAAEQFWVNV
jgi:hypothetical protein